MIGDEGVRRLTEQHLVALLPARLDLIRAATPPVPVDHAPAVWPPNPHVMCADQIPDRSDRLPAVMVGSAQLLKLSADEGGAATSWIGSYQFDISVVCVSPQAGADVIASIGRDRLLLAVREICLSSPQVGPGVMLLTRDITTESGPAKQDQASRPMAAGVLTVAAQAIETLDEHTWPVTDLSTTITAHDAAQPLNT